MFHHTVKFYKTIQLKNMGKLKNQHTMNVIFECVRYVETVLKVDQQLKERKLLDFGPSNVILQTSINNLQDEHVSIPVKVNLT